MRLAEYRIARRRPDNRCYFGGRKRVAGPKRAELVYFFSGPELAGQVYDVVNCARVAGPPHSENDLRNMAAANAENHLNLVGLRALGPHVEHRVPIVPPNAAHTRLPAGQPLTRSERTT